MAIDAEGIAALRQQLIDLNLETLGVLDFMAKGDSVAEALWRIRAYMMLAAVHRMSEATGCPVCYGHREQSGVDWVHEPGCWAQPVIASDVFRQLL